MDAKQCRMARAALGWSLDRLAAEASVARRSLASFEGGGAVRLETIEALRSALTTGGALFVEQEGRRGVLVR